MKNVLIINSVSSGAPPGTIHRIYARRQSMPEELFSLSSHALGSGHAVNIIIYGIEGEQFAAGSILSREVQEALTEVLHLVTLNYSLFRMMY